MRSISVRNDWDLTCFVYIIKFGGYWWRSNKKHRWVLKSKSRRKTTKWIWCLKTQLTRKGTNPRTLQERKITSSSRMRLQKWRKRKLTKKIKMRNSLCRMKDNAMKLSVRKLKKTRTIRKLIKIKSLLYMSPTYHKSCQEMRTVFKNKLRSRLVILLIRLSKFSTFLSLFRHKTKLKVGRKDKSLHKCRLYNKSISIILNKSKDKNKWDKNKLIMLLSWHASSKKKLKKIWLILTKSSD